MHVDLEKLASLPTWLRVLDEPDIVRAALMRSIPDFRSGALLLRDVELERARHKEGIWNVQYRLFVEDKDGKATVFLVAGPLHPPASHGLDGVFSSGTFGTDGWRAVVPDLGLLLAAGAPDKELAAFPILMGPDTARVILEHGLREHSPTPTSVFGRVCPSWCATRRAAAAPSSTGWNTSPTRRTGGSRMR